MTPPQHSRVLYVVVCGAGPASQVGVLLGLAISQNWDPHVIATPIGATFIDRDAIETQTSHPVRTDYRSPGTPRQSLPNADATIVAPATFNTINKLATGISDTYALGVLAECVGVGVPTVVLPFVNTALAARAPFQRAIESLRKEGVHVLLGEGGFQPHPPRTGESRITKFPWGLGIQRASELVSDKDTPSNS